MQLYIWKNHIQHISGTNSKDTITPLLASLLKTTAQYDSCNQASHTQSQIIHLVRKIAYPLNGQV